MKVLFLITDGFGIGGTVRTTFNLAGALADRGHDVEVLSTLRRRDVPMMAAHPAIRLMALLDARPDHPDYVRDDPRRGKPTRVYPRADFRSGDYDLLVEQRYAQYLRASDADVVIGTRSGLIAYVARFAPSRMIRIGQEHLTRKQNGIILRAVMPHHYRRLDAFVTVSARDAEDYRAHVRMGRARLVFIPNSVPAPRVPPSTGAAKIVVAAGRLVASKRYDLLIRAFAKVVAEHPDWRLRVYGAGDQDDALRGLVLELGLHNHVLMMGPYSPIEPEWAKGSIAAVPSDREPFGMTLVEAMRCGLPVVSTDAPYGPAEIIADGVDGLLTPVGDPDALADALLRVIGDDRRRRDMSAAALANSARYDPAPIAERYERLFEELAAARAARRRWFRPRSRPGEPAPVLGPAPTLGMATADCEVTRDGDLVLRPNSGVPEGSALVWRRVGAPPPVEVPVEAAGELPEASWDLWIRGGGPVYAGVRDTRALVDLPVPARGGVRIGLPYRTADGRLALHVWRRVVHAEVGDVRADDGLRLSGRLVGAAFGPEDPALELRGPGTIDPVPVRVLTATTWSAQVPPVPAGTWELWLRHARGTPPVRLGRLLDDVVNKRTAYVLPPVRLGDVEVRPFYTGSNDLSVRATA
ncbi:MAG TPA: glycosyltransferase family 4 protein [Actinoplanes sp.]|jgi:glycosyltransferase involved in cell wall biosynthesis|nr:glycosyltransferase family 4 protein [Actinoplanes sp.]